MNTWDVYYESGKGFTPLNETYLDRLLNELTRLLGKKPTEILDLGCGDGDAIVKFARHGIRSIGVDSSTEGLRIADGRIDAYGVRDRVTLINQDIAEYAPEKKFPMVFCRLTIAFIPQRESFVQRVRGMLDVPGVFVVITPVTYPSLHYDKADKPGIAVDHDDFVRLLRSTFDEVIDWHRDYFADRGETVTFVCIARDDRG